jgi:hypothetical protein
MSIPRLIAASLLLWLFAVPVALADVLRPLVLAYTTAGTDIAAEAEKVRERLSAAGFRVVGEYPVHAGARVIIVTSDDLLAAAARSPRGGYIAPLRVAVTRVGGQLQVSHVNLDYLRHAYRIEAPLATITQRLAGALGAGEPFGARGVPVAELARYRYAFGMERFGDPYLLAQYADRSRALAVIDRNLRAGKAGVREVYRIDIPGRDATVIGVSIREEDGAEREAADLHHLATVDVAERRHTAYLPYEILVEGGRVEALHLRFRMALHFPDLGMMGENSFMQLRRAPAAVERTLTQAVSP